MPVIKAFLVLIVLSGLAAGGLYAASNRGLISDQYLSSALVLFNDQDQLTQLTTAAQNQVLTLSSLAEVAASQSGSVLGKVIDSEKEAPPLPQRAFEFARYSYCQEVIKDYQSRTEETIPAAQ